jgi:hypothetical protein
MSGAVKRLPGGPRPLGALPPAAAARLPWLSLSEPSASGPLPAPSLPLQQVLEGINSVEGCEAIMYQASPNRCCSRKCRCHPAPAMLPPRLLGSDPSL